MRYFHDVRNRAEGNWVRNTNIAFHCPVPYINELYSGLVKVRMPSESSTLRASEWQREAEQGMNMDCDGVSINSNCNNGGMQVN